MHRLLKSRRRLRARVFSENVGPRGSIGTGTLRNRNRRGAGRQRRPCCGARRHPELGSGVGQPADGSVPESSLGARNAPGAAHHRPDGGNQQRTGQLERPQIENQRPSLRSPRRWRWRQVSPAKPRLFTWLMVLIRRTPNDTGQHCGDCRPRSVSFSDSAESTPFSASARTGTYHHRAGVDNHLDDTQNSASLGHVEQSPG